MKNEDIWAGLGAILSTILSGISWIWQIGLLQTLFTFLTGALVTFFVESKLQARTEKRRLRVKAIEELHIPLFLEIEKIRKNLLLDLEPTGIGAWHKLVEKPQMFTLNYEFREQLLDFFKKSQKIAADLESIKRIAAEIIYKNVEKQLFPVLKNEGLIEINEKIGNPRIDKWKEGTGFGLQLRGPHFIYEAPVTVCAILNQDPIEFLEENRRTFEVDQLILFIKIHYMIGGSLKEQNFDIPIMENATIFRDFWKKTIQCVQENTDVKKFNNMRLDMIPISERILSRLQKHIEKYIITEKI